jgi:hypothetical protein
MWDAQGHVHHRHLSSHPHPHHPLICEPHSFENCQHISSLTTEANMQTGLDNIAENPTSVAQFRDLKRSTDVWFDDGNYVLQAEDTLFKVYGGILSKYCLFFRTLLSLPQGGSPDQMMYENCPLIPLMGDAADEVGYFLRALFDLQ